MQMAASMGKSLGKPYNVICMCVCVHVHACMGHPPTPIHPHTPKGGPPNQLKNKT